MPTLDWIGKKAVIDKAITACQKSGYDPKDHFAHISKMVDLGTGATREIEDIALTRFVVIGRPLGKDP